MSKLVKHSDLDAMLWPGVDQNPVGLLVKLGCMASLLLLVISWVILIIAMGGRVIEWAGWPFIALPLGLWLVLLAFPAFLSARRGTLAVLDAIAATAEAWLARAGYSVDLNGDGRIGYDEIEVEPVRNEITRPVRWNNGEGTRLLASDSPAQADPGPGPERPTITRRLWELPNGQRSPVESVCQFVDGIFIRGWSRETWVPKRLDRETYEGLIMLLEAGNILEGRKAGYAGRLTVASSSEARGVLGLPSSAGTVRTATTDNGGDSLIGRYEHI